MNKNLIDKIYEFTKYLKEYESDKNYYEQQLLPAIFEDYKISGLPLDAKTLFYEIRQKTTAQEWADIINIVLKIKYHYDDIQNSCKINKFKNFISFLQKYFQFQGFFHTTTFDNFIKIMECETLYSRYSLSSKSISYKDISLNEVINQTKKDIIKFVRFYYREKTPTNYDNEGIKPKKVLNSGSNLQAHSPLPVILIFNPNIIYDNPKVRFADGNAAKQKTTLYRSFTDLVNMDWESVFHKNIIMEYEDRSTITNKRNSEILYYDSISTRNIEKIIFRSNADYKRAKLLLGDDKRYVVNPEYFFNLWLLINDYDYKKSRNNITLQIEYLLGEYMSNYSLQDFSHKIEYYKANQKIKEYYINDSLIGNCVEKFQGYPKIVTEEIIIPLIGCDYILYTVDDIECIRIINDD